MDKTPLISIITPSYNQAQFIERTILSVLNQTYSFIQYIIVDGGSTDNTMEIIDRYRDRIDIVISEKDNGQSDAINKGFHLAKGQLVGWINSDDTLQPDCVEKIVELYTRHPNGSIYFGNILNRIDADDHLIDTYSVNIHSQSDLLYKDYSIIQQGSFYSTAILHEIGLLNVNLNYCMDLDLWLRLLEHGPIYSIANSAIANFRFWEDSKTCSQSYKFLKEIRSLLGNVYHVHFYHHTMIQLNYYIFKEYIKSLLFYR